MAKAKTTRTLRDFINLHAKNEFAMFVRDSPERAAKKFVHGIYTEAFDTCRKTIDVHLSSITEKIKVVTTIREMEGMSIQAMTPEIANKILDAIEVAARKFELNIVEQVYIFRECFTAIDIQLEKTIQSIVLARHRQLQQAPGLVDASGNAI